MGLYYEVSLVSCDFFTAGRELDSVYNVVAGAKTKLL
jgi:hypothetical protein